MALHGDLVGDRLVDNVARTMGVDWIRVNHDRMLRFEPDLVKEDSNHRQRNFWCPEVMWHVNGKTYVAAVPVKTKIRKWAPLKLLGIFEVVPGGWAPEEDQNAMLEELADLIRQTL